MSTSAPPWEFPPLTMGLWAVGGRGWGPVDDRVTLRALDEALEQGCNAFDTAPFYGYGHSEEVLGRFLKGRRRKVLVFTKAGLRWGAGERVRVDLSRRSLKQELDESLRRLGTDYIDLYQIHWPSDEYAAEEFMPLLAELKKSGKIRAAGLCNFSLAGLREAQKYGPVDTLQIPLSILRPCTEPELLTWCEEQGVAVLPYGVLGRGVLTGKYDLEPSFGRRDIRTKDPNFHGARFRLIGEFVAERLQPLARKLGISIPGLLLSRARTLPGVRSVLVGVKTPEQVRENLRMRQLAPEVERELDRAAEILMEKLHKLEGNQWEN
jgi:aryl-alcohol dehydrogenase-like predicted oxidoreductase